MIEKEKVIDYFKEYEKPPKALPRELTLPLTSDKEEGEEKIEEKRIKFIPL